VRVDISKCRNNPVRKVIKIEKEQKTIQNMGIYARTEASLNFNQMQEDVCYLVVAS